MFWLTLLLVWAVASIVVAVVWGGVAHLSEDCGDERPEAASTSTSDSRTKIPAPDDPRRSSQR